MVTLSKDRLAPGDHAVLFHRSEGQLRATVGSHLAAALEGGAAAVVLATGQHLGAFAEELSVRGIDVPEARRSGRLVELDAADMLARFLVDGVPDRVAFEAVIGDVLRRSGADGRQVWAYGEMVALLWEAGQVPAAIELEDLWNGLGQQLSFSLLCGYPSELMDGDEHADARAAVCHRHSAVMGPLDESATAVFVASPNSPAAARRFVAETLGRWGRAEMVDDAVLVASELATNAVFHATSDFRLTLSRVNGFVRMAVRDASRTEPVVRGMDRLAASGRGMLLVDALVERWGCEVLDDGKRVWVEFDVGGGS